jgi:hypothetical protein
MAETFPELVSHPSACRVIRGPAYRPANPDGFVVEYRDEQKPWFGVVAGPSNAGRSAACGNPLG